MKLMKETNISRTYHTFHNLALKFHQSNRIIQSEELIFILAEVFFKSTNHEDLEIVVPFLLDTLVTLMDLSLPQPKYRKLAEELFDKLPDVSLATILEHRNNINFNNETFFQLLANLIGRRILNGFVTAQPDHSPAASLKEGNQTILSQLIKKDNCNAFMDHLKIFSPAVARQALNAIIANLGCEIAPSLDALTDSFSFLVTIESNELLTNETRPTLFFTSVVQHHLPTLSLLPRRLQTSGAVSRQSKHALKIYRALMESLVINQVWDVVRLSGDVVEEVVDCLFWLGDEPLNLLFINELNLLQDRSFKCFRSKLLKNFVVSVLKGEKPDLEESKATHLVRLWMKYLATLEGSINLNSSLLSKILYFCYPSNLNQRDNRLSKLLVHLVDKVKPDLLVGFLIGVQDERMKDTDRVMADGVSYLCVLYKACLKLMSDPLCLASLPDEKRNAVLLMLDTVFRLGDEKMVVDLARLILDNKDLPHSNPILYDELMDSCSALERVPLSGAKEDVERDSSWCFRDAVVPGNRQLENFLRSDLRCQSFGGNYSVREKAVAFGSRLVGISPSPVLLQVKTVGMSYVCELVKEHSSPALPVEGQSVSPSNQATPQRVVPSPSPKHDASAVSTWCIEDLVPAHRQLESFLRLDRQSQLSPSFTVVGIKQVEGGYFREATKALPRQSTHPALPLTTVNPTSAVLPVPNWQPPHLIGDDSKRKRRHRNRSRSKNRLPDKRFVN